MKRTAVDKRWATVRLSSKANCRRRHMKKSTKVIAEEANATTSRLRLYAFQLIGFRCDRVMSKTRYGTHIQRNADGIHANKVSTRHEVSRGAFVFQLMSLSYGAVNQISIVVSSFEFR